MTGIILVGGKSRRMGQDKAVMSVGGKQVFRRILDVFEALFDEILIVTDKKGRFADYGYPEVVDLMPDSGPMGGIYTGLFYAKSEKVFAASCDLPFLNPVPVEAIIKEAVDYDIVVPEISGRLHPLHAVYSKRCMPYILTRIEKNERNITRFINEISMSLPLTKGDENQRDRNVPPIHDTYADRRGFLTPPKGFSDETNELSVKKIQMTGLTPEDMWEQTVFNMNTPEEWQEADALEKAKGSKKLEARGKM